MNNVYLTTLELEGNEHLDIYTKDPDYGNLTKRSHRARKSVTIEGTNGKQKLPCLECGNASIVFQFDWNQDLYDSLSDWWDFEYKKKGEEFLVELYKHYGNSIEWRVMSKKPFYEARRKGFDSVKVDVEVNVLEALKTLPEDLTWCVELVYISDWDYLDYANEI